MMQRKETNRVIFHHSLTDGGDVDTFRKYHMAVNGWEDVGYHFVILRDGTLQDGRDIRLMGDHAKGKNRDSVGICLVGDFTKYGPSDQQVFTAGNIFHGICRAYSKSLKIEFHRDWPNPCPGPKLDRKEFVNMVNKYNPYI